MLSPYRKPTAKYYITNGALSSALFLRSAQANVSERIHAAATNPKGMVAAARAIKTLPGHPLGTVSQSASRHRMGAKSTEERHQDEK